MFILIALCTALCLQGLSFSWVHILCVEDQALSRVPRHDNQTTPHRVPLDEIAASKQKIGMLASVLTQKICISVNLLDQADI